MNLDECMHARCTAPAVVVLRAKYDRYPWPACAEHRGAMQTALGIGQPSDGGLVHVTIERQ